MFHFKLHGDADHGWIGEVHDGDTHKVYNPEGADVKTAVGDMLADHFGEKKAPTKAEIAAEDKKAAAEAQKAQDDLQKAQIKAQIKAQADMKAAQAKLPEPSKPA